MPDAKILTGFSYNEKIRLRPDFFVYTFVSI